MENVSGETFSQNGKTIIYIIHGSKEEEKAKPDLLIHVCMHGSNTRLDCNLDKLLHFCYGVCQQKVNH